MEPENDEQAGGAAPEGEPGVDPVLGALDAAAAEGAGGPTEAPGDALPVPAAADVYLEPLAGPLAARGGGTDLGPVLDVPVELTVEIGRTTMTIRETLALGPGSIVSLDKLAGEPVDLLVNGRRIARGEVVAVDEEFGLRVTEIVSPERRIGAAG
jgi:flagellar motor switch protein FliN/FliY